MALTFDVIECKSKSPFPLQVVGRFIVGFGVSLSAIAECIYISEIAPAVSLVFFLINLNANVSIVYFSGLTFYSLILLLLSLSCGP